jgi:hypothetical protein
MLSVGILMASFPTKQTLALRIILVHFATKTHIKERLLSVGNVPKGDVGIAISDCVMLAESRQSEFSKSISA